jgi:hypothetical protein
MPASQYFTQVQIDFLAYYGRPADPAGMLFWAGKIADAGGNNQAVIDAFSTSPESLALFGQITSANIEQVVKLFFLRDFNRLPDPAGLKFYVDGFNAGTFTAGTIALNIFNGAQNADATALGNKLHVADAVTQLIAGHSFNDPLFGHPPFTTTYAGTGDADSARDFMQDVHSDPGSVPSGLAITLFLQNILANPGDSILLDGQEFILTPFVDAGKDFKGGAADNKYFASGTTLTPGDNLDGGGGDNSFLYQSGDPNSGGPVSHSGFMTKNIQNFFLTADVDTTLDMSGTKDVVWVTDTNSADNLTLTHGPEITKVLMQNTTVAHCLTIDYQASTVSGKADKQTLWLDGVLAGSAVHIDGIETMNVTTLNNDSSLWKIESDSLKTFNLDGTKSLTLGSLDFPGDGTLTSANKGDLTIKYLSFDGSGTVDANNTGDLTLNHVWFGKGSSSIDASGIGGKMDVTLENAGDPLRVVAVTGGGKGDTLDVQAGFDKGDTFEGGGGIDHIVMNTETFDVNTNAITHVEVADIESGEVDDFDAGWFDTSLALINVDTTAGSTMRFLNLENDGSEHIVVDNSEADLDGKTVQFEPLNSGKGGLTVDFTVNHVDSTVDVTFGDFDNVGIASQDPVGTMHLTANGSGTLDALFDPMSGLSTLYLSGSASMTLSADEGVHSVTFIDGAGKSGFDVATGDIDVTEGLLSNGGATVLLGPGHDTVIGGAGSDSIDIGTGGGFVDAGSGDDTVAASGAADVTVYGDDGNDSIATGAGSDKLVGGNGADNLSSGASSDILEGDGGADVMDGGLGDDSLWGGLGADTQTGGAGVDTFHYEFVTESQGTFIDKITDFVSGTDKIDLLDALINAAAPVTSMADVDFVGNANGPLAAKSALTGSGQVEIVYDTLLHQVYVDVNGDGDIDGTNDMVIDLDPPATLQASDFGIPQGNVYTAAVVGFNTDNPADSFENTTTSSGPDIVRAEGGRIPGSNIDGHGGGDTLSVTTPLGAFDLGTVMDTEFINLNLNGTTGHVIGPDQDVNLHIYISSKGGDFETGTSLFHIVPVVQTVDSGNGNDTITLTNFNDIATTRDGKDHVTTTAEDYVGAIDTGKGDDLVNLIDGFNGSVTMGLGADEVEVAANASFGTGALLDGGGDSSGDELELFNFADVSRAAGITGFDHVTMPTPILGTGSATMALRDYVNLGSYNAAPGAGNPIHTGILTDDTMRLMGGGDATLDDSVDHWEGDPNGGVSQTFTLGSDDQDVTLFNSAIFGSPDRIINTFDRAHADYTSSGAGGGDVFEQTVSANFVSGGAGVFSGFEILQLDSGADVTMTNSQHNSFNAILGLNGPPFGTDTNTVEITNAFNGTTSNTVESYVLDNNGGVNNYTVGGNNQTVTDNDTSGSTVGFLNNLNGVTLHTSSGADSITLGSGESNITVTSDGGADTVSASFGGTNISITTDANDVVNLGGTHTGLSVNTGPDQDIVNMANGSTLSGNINVGTGAPDTLNFGTGNYGGLSISGMAAGDNVNLTTPGTYTFNANTYNDVITGAPTLNVGAGGAVDATTIHISDASASSTLGWVNFSNNPAEDVGTFGTLVMDSSGSDFVKFSEQNFANKQQLTISAGGSDKVQINNTSFEAGNPPDDYLTITGFNVADDKLVLQNAGVAGGVDQIVLATDDPLTVNQNGVVIVNTTAAPSGLLSPLDCSNFGAVESYLGGAIGSTGAVTSFMAVLYATDGNAYVYQVNCAPVLNLSPVTADVELIGQLNGVAANSLGLGNFASS